MGDLKYYSPEQVAEILGVTRRSVYNYLTDGRLPAQQLSGRVWKITEEDIREFMERNRAETEARIQKKKQAKKKPANPEGEELPF